MTNSPELGVGVDIESIKRIVTQAGDLAMSYYGHVSRSVKEDQSVVSEADAAVERFFRSSLAALTPGLGYIGEETETSVPPDPGEDRSWIVDALDGSRAFVAGMPLWTPAVCLLRGAGPIAGAAFNPITGELFWADEDGPAFCNDQPLGPAPEVPLEPNTFISGPTNHHRTFEIDFPGRVYCLGAPIYQLCLLAKGAVVGFFFDPMINVWDVALPSLLLRKTGAVLEYGSGRPVDLSELMNRDSVPEPVYAGHPAMVEVMRQRIRYKG